MTGIIAPKPVRVGALLGSAASDSTSVLPATSTQLSPIPRKHKPAPRSPKSSLKSPNSKPTSNTTTPSGPPSRTERRFTCTFAGCGKAYFKPSRLAEHMRTHTGERPHVCDQCGQTYLRASHLTAHQRTHKSEEDKEFACPREGCDKKFWTATHLARHEASHDSAQVHPCEVPGCGEGFPKTHLLREHVVAVHMPEGSKPWACSHEGCGRSFSTKQQLRTHEKTHDPTRYTCSHPIHGLNMPTFPVWSALQAHIRDAHPPTCPHAECEGRAFKNAGRLREHLRVHAEREADIASGLATSDTEDLPPVLAEASGRKKRKRGSMTPAPNTPASTGSTTPSIKNAKLPRLAGGEAGKDWICGAPGCGARFKTKFARDEHSQASHSSGRHKCDVCGRSYRRPASLKRHKVGGWCGKQDGSEGSGEEHKEGDGALRSRVPPTRRRDAPIGDLLTGTATLPGGALHRRWACPYVYQAREGEGAEEEGGEKGINGEMEGHEAEAAEAGNEDEDDGKKYAYCEDRFFRVYDVRRHLASVHKMVLDDMATREMLLADGQTGEEEDD